MPDTAAIPFSKYWTEYYASVRVAKAAHLPFPPQPAELEPPSQSAGAQILDRLVAAEEVEERTQGLPVLAFELRVAFEHQARVVMGDRDQLLMDR